MAGRLSHSPLFFVIEDISFDNKITRFHKKAALVEKYQELVSLLFADKTSEVTKWMSRMNRDHNPVHLHFSWYHPGEWLPLRDSVQIDIKLTKRPESQIVGVSRAFRPDEFDDEAQKTLIELHKLAQAIIPTPTPTPTGTPNPI